MFYKSMEKQSELPPEHSNDATFLEAINLICALQNQDPDYKNI